MHRNADLRQNGNVDGDDIINLPPNVEEIFEVSRVDENIDKDDNVDNDVNVSSPETRAAVDDDDLISALLALGEVVHESTNSESTISVEGRDRSSIETETHPSLPPLPPMHLPPDTTPSPSEIPDSEIPDVVKNRFLGKHFKFTSAIPIPASGRTPAGYKSPVSEVELQAIEDLQLGSTYKTQRTRLEEETRTTMVRGFNGTSNYGVEELFHRYCETAGCKCEMKTARFDSKHCNSYILCYELLDKETDQPFVHSNHAIRKEEQKQFRPANKVGGNATTERTKSKYDGLTLSNAQQDYIKKFGMGEVGKGDWKALAEAMARSSQVELTEEQENDIDGFAGRIRNFVKYRKSRGDRFFVSQWGQQKMSGNDCKAVLDALKTPSSERGSLPPLENIPFIQSSAFKSVWEKIEVVKHDYEGDGNTFDHILLQYNDAKLRAQKAATMFPDNGAQLEMDFFKGASADDEWQVGHIGFSDLNHRYWILGMVIARSENADAAGLILRHALQLLEEAGGQVIRVLVDGGKALSAAIRNENEVRELVEKVRLEVRRCLAHCLRRPFSRGGGYRGGKGSVHKALIDNEVSRPNVGKIVGLMLLMTFIPPTDNERYESAVDLLIKEYGEHLSANFRAQYLTKNPNHLGGLCAGRAGEVASTQGGERRGGHIKICINEVLKLFGLGSLQRNPLFAIAGIARDGMRKQNNIENVAVTPNRAKVERSAYEGLINISTYTVPDPDALIGEAQKRRSNFCADWIYALCIVTTTDAAGNAVEKEVPLHYVLGKAGVEFEVIFPSMSALFTDLKITFLEDAQFNIGAPMSMQIQSMSVGSVRNMLRDPFGCARALTTLDHSSQKKLKCRIHDRLRNNTPAPKPGENLYMFLQRGGHRDESAVANQRFATKHEKSVGKASKKKKKKTKKSKKHEDKLERDKWGGQKEEEAEEDLAQFCELCEDWDDDAEIEDLVKIIENTIIDDAGGLDGSGVGGDGIEDDVEMFVFDEEEIAKLNSQAESSERVRVLRELGEGTTVSVGKECNKMCCNCEMFNRWRICRHVIWIEVLHFGKFPSGDISDAEDSWEFIRQRILDIIKKTHIDVSSVF